MISLMLFIVAFFKRGGGRATLEKSCRVRPRKKKRNPIRINDSVIQLHRPTRRQPKIMSVCVFMRASSTNSVLFFYRSGSFFWLFLPRGAEGKLIFKTERVIFSSGARIGVPFVAGCAFELMSPIDHPNDLLRFFS